MILPLGSIPQANAGTVASTMTVVITCGIALTGAFTFTGINVGDVLTQTDNDVAQPTIGNTGTGESQVSVGVGDDANGGGYAGTTDNTTHIAAASIQVNIGEGLVAMVSNANTAVGQIASDAIDNIDVQITVTLVNPGSSDANWAATYTFTQTDCLLQ